jgi:hypothetical protein
MFELPFRRHWNTSGKAIPCFGNVDSTFVSVGDNVNSTFVPVDDNVNWTLENDGSTPDNV